MSSYPPPVPPSQQAHFPPLPPQLPRQKNWFDRNWRWLVPTLVVTAVGVLALFVGGILLFVSTMFTSSDPYKLAVHRAMESPAVQAKLGTPLHIGWLTSGNINLNGPTGEANLSIPISGPRGSGKIIVAAKKRANHWNYDALEVDVSPDNQPIPLLDAASPSVPALPDAKPPDPPDGTT
jgi:Cytochrome oxidase complex assembly protein 1